MSEHEQNLLLSAALWATNTKPKIEISDPVKRAPMGRDCDEDANQQVPEPGAIINPKIDIHNLLSMLIRCIPSDNLPMVSLCKDNYNGKIM